MKKLYPCKYVHPRSGRPSIRGSYEPGYCHVHRNSPVWYSCPDCGKLTCSKYGRCDKDAMKYRKREQYHKKKASQIGALVEEYKNGIKNSSRDERIFWNRPLL